MAEKRCQNGHFIDAAWDLCPYCPAEQPRSEIKIVRPRTEAVAPEEVRVKEPSARAIAIIDPAGMPQRTVAALKAQLAEPKANRYVVGWLVGLDSGLRGESFAIRNGRNVLGRDRRSDVVVNDEQASAHHADLVYRPEEGRYILMDHNSTNGTYVNEMEIEPRRDLSHRDVIRIGAQRLMFFALCREGFSWDEQDQVK